ncbi:MAG: HAMP domain-containing histidine kinase [bacterium]|nr:MAG: HAMP domain-containing histidine kinase [bacterium]
MKKKLILFILVPIMSYAKLDIDSLKGELYFSKDTEKLEIIEHLIEYYNQNNLDSLYLYSEMKLKYSIKLLDSTKIAESYLNVANAQGFMNNYSIALKNILKADTIYSILGDSTGIAHCYFYLGHLHYYLNEFNKSREFLKICERIYDKNGNFEKLGECYLYLAFVEMGFANYNYALDYAFMASKFALMSERENLVVKVYIIISDIYAALGNFKESKFYILKAFGFFMSNGSLWDKALTAYKFGFIYHQLGDQDSAKIYITIAKNHFRKLNHVSGELLVNTYYSKILTIEGNYDESITLLENSLKISVNNNIPWMISEISQQLGELYLIKGEFEKASDHILNALDLAKKIEAKDLVLNNYRSLAKYYENIGDHYNAYATYKKYSDLKDSLFIKNQNDITDLQVEYYTNQIKEENELLQKDLAISKLEADRQKLLTTIFFLGLLIFTITSSMIYLLYRRNKKNNLILEEKIDLALKAQREQQQIIVHQSALNAMGEFTAGIAHEISQPVQNIILSLQQMELNQKSESKREKNDHTFTEIYEDLNRVQYAIDHIRLFSSRQQEEYSELFSVNDILNQAYRMVRKQYEKLGIKLHFSLESYLPELTGNPFKLEQVFINLLSNAKDAVQEKHRQSLNGSEKIISIENYQNKEQIIVKIKDNGSGIPPEIQSQMFLPFFTTKKLGEGQGLGLSIANEIVKDFGGFIEIHSEMGQGTEVMVYLPLRKTG